MAKDAPKGKTGKSAKKKRDPNKPLPKPKKKGRLVLKVAVTGVAVVLGVWLALFSIDRGKGPWAFSGEDWGDFLTFSREQVSDAVDQARQVDWAAIGDEITEKTRELWNGTAEWEAKLDRRLADMRGDEGAGGGAATTDAGDGGEGDAAAGGEEPAADAKPSDYELGCERFREGLRTYRRSVPSGDGRSDAELQRELVAAKGLFQEAADHLARAYDAAEARGDAVEAAEIEEVLMECNRYLEDCSKRQTL